MSLKVLLKDSIIFGGANFIGKFVSFLIFPLLATSLTPLAFGSLELVLTSVTLMGTIINCGLNNAVQRYYFEKEYTGSLQPTIVTSGLAVQMIFGLIVFLMGLGLVGVFETLISKNSLPISKIAIFAALLLMLTNQWNRFLLDVTRLHFAPWRFFTLEVVIRVSGLLLAFFSVVYLGQGIDGLISMLALVGIIGFPLSLWMVKKDLTFKVSIDWIKKLVNFGYPYIFMGLAYWLFGSIDRWMLASMTNIEEVGIYSIAFRLSTVVLFVSTAFGTAWSPYALKLYAQSPKTYKGFYTKVLYLIFSVMLIFAGGVSLFAKDIISLLLPDNYIKSILPFVILCFSVVIQSTIHVSALGLTIEKKTTLFAKISWIAAVINIFLNWIFIPKWGALGAAISTALSYFFITSSYLYFSQKVHPLPITKSKLIFMFLNFGIMMTLSLKTIELEFSLTIFFVKLLGLFICFSIALKTLSLKFKDLTMMLKVK